MFSSIISNKKINKLNKRTLRLCHNDYISSYGEHLSKQDLVNIHIRNIQQVMIEIFKFLKGISLPIMNEIFRLRNIPYTIRNPRDLDSQLPKTVFCGLETTAYKGPQLWQQLLTKTIKGTSLVNFRQNIKLWKNPTYSCWVSKHKLDDLDSYKKTCTPKLLFYFYYYY